MTNNFIAIQRGLSIRGAMSELVRQAGRHDNIATLYVLDEDGHYAGAIDLKDLIIARESDSLEELISRSYPTSASTRKSPTASTASPTTPRIPSPC